MVTIHRVEQGTPEWLALRAGKYTGSGADKVLKFGAIPYSLANSSDFKGNFWTKRGHILEEEAIYLYEQITKNAVDRPGFITNSKYPSAGYSPDGLAGATLIEVKCFDVKAHQELLNVKKFIDIPLKITAQIFFGLLIAELPQAVLLAYNPSKDENGQPVFAVKDQLRIITIKAQPRIAANFRRILKKEVLHAAN